MKHIELHQDNILAQICEINGKFSRSIRTKHINAKIFFVKNNIDARDIVIKDCPTEVMYADILTKSRQYISFREMRSVLMKCPVD